MRDGVMAEVASTAREASASCSICREGVCATCGPVLDRREIAVFIVAGLLLLFGILAVYVITWTLAGNLLLLAAAVVSGRDVLKTAAVSLIRFRFSIAVLIAIAAAGAFLIGNPAEGATVLYLYAIAEFLEEYAAGRAERSIASLL
ncbi:MAG TPA: cation-transporting P-type ATPase, partial [Methanoculleus sp.]|nr:cation-transporting P-type ATPase [Methanoculleus sp.]